jgi:hypothetical protein
MGGLLLALAIFFAIDGVVLLVARLHGPVFLGYANPLQITRTVNALTVGCSLSFLLSGLFLRSWHRLYSRMKPYGKLAQVMEPIRNRLFYRMSSFTSIKIRATAGKSYARNARLMATGYASESAMGRFINVGFADQ